MITKIVRRVAGRLALGFKQIAQSLMLFDATLYLSLYPDVASAIRDGHFVDALDHFKKHGMEEGRFPGFYGFSPEEYLRKNPAVRRELDGSDDHAVAREHFFRVGYNARLPYC